MNLMTATPNALTDARALFPGLLQLTYLDVAGRAPLCTPVRAAIERFLDAAETGGDKAAMFRSIEAARNAYARLVNASADEIAITKNISEGLNIVANGIDWRPGDNVVLCEELEHANNIYVWRNLARRLGVQVRSLRPQDGEYPVAAMAAAVDERTRIVTACTHTFTPGFRTPLERCCCSTVPRPSASATWIWRPCRSTRWPSRRKRACSAHTAWAFFTCAASGPSGSARCTWRALASIWARPGKRPPRAATCG